MTVLRAIDPTSDADAVRQIFTAAQVAGDVDLLRQAPDIDSTDAARTYLESLAADAWAVDAGGTLVGVVAATARSSQHRSAWMSYWLAPEARGRGVAAQALAAASALLFAEGFHRLELGVRTDNRASIRTAELAGYLHEGTNREELEYDGVRFDTVRMARLATDPMPGLVLF